MARDDLPRQLQELEAFLDRRRAGGDNLAEPRPVDHSAYFWRRGRALDAAQALAARGYQVEVERDAVRWALDASKEAALDLASATAMLQEVVPLVNRHGGTYDGWGAFGV